MKKKLLSLIICLALVFTSVVNAFAFTDTNSTAVSTLVNLGIITGYTDNTFKPNKTIQRAEMAAILMRALGYGTIEQMNTDFSDVPKDHWASGYINCASYLGIINGYGNGKFGPKNTLTYGQAIAMIVRALGYTDNYLRSIYTNFAYPSTHSNYAINLGLLRGVNASNLNAYIPRIDVAQIIYNALNVPIASFDEYGNIISNSTDTMLYRHQNSVEYENGTNYSGDNYNSSNSSNSTNYANNLDYITAVATDNNSKINNINYYNVVYNNSNNTTDSNNSTTTSNTTTTTTNNTITNSYNTNNGGAGTNSSSNNSDSSNNNGDTSNNNNNNDDDVINTLSTRYAVINDSGAMMLDNGGSCNYFDGCINGKSVEDVKCAVKIPTDYYKKVYRLDYNGDYVIKFTEVSADVQGYITDTANGNIKLSSGWCTISNNAALYRLTRRVYSARNNYTVGDYAMMYDVNSDDVYEIVVYFEN